MLYRKKTGCQWRLLPKDFSPHDTVWSFYRRAVQKGVWGKAMDKMVKKVRVDAGRTPEPSYGLIDSQSAKTTNKNENRGIDGEKKVKVRKRHIMTDIMGNLLVVKVHAANIHDTMSGCHVYQAGDEVSVHFSKRFWDFASRQAGTADANGGLRPVRGAREPASGAWGLCHQQAGRCTHLPLLTGIIST